MAKLVERAAKELCVECSEQHNTLHAVKTIVVGQTKRIPLCKNHLDELMADFAAESVG